MGRVRPICPDSLESQCQNHKTIIQNFLCFLLTIVCIFLFILFSSLLLWLLSIKFITRCLHMATDSVPLCNGRRDLQVVLSVMMQSAVMMLQCLGPLCLQHAVVTAVRARSALNLTQLSDWIIMNLSSQTSLRLKANSHHKLRVSSVGVSLHFAVFWQNSCLPLFRVTVSATRYGPRDSAVRPRAALGSRRS